MAGYRTFTRCHQPTQCEEKFWSQHSICKIGFSMNWKATVMIFCFCSLAIAMQAADIWVSPNGSDNNPGTKDKPIATVSMALRKAREMRRLHDAGVAGGIHIIVQKGI